MPGGALLEREGILSAALPQAIGATRFGFGVQLIRPVFMGRPMRALDLQAFGAVDAALLSSGQGSALLLAQRLAIALHEVRAEARKGFRFWFWFGQGFGGGFRVGDCEDAGQEDGEIDGGEFHSGFGDGFGDGFLLLESWRGWGGGGISDVKGGVML